MTFGAPLRAIAAAVLVASACSGGAGPVDADGPVGAHGPPNVVLIVADDLSADGFARGFHRSLDAPSALEDDLIEAGTLLPNFFLPTPLCCPSRASFLTGQYPHNHRVHVNHPARASDGNGGLFRFWSDGREDTSLGVWMQQAGYRTGFVGKYLNGYPNLQGLAALGVTEEYVPRGWDDWHAVFINDRASSAPFDFSYYRFRSNDNGEVTVQDGGAYLTDWERDTALRFIDAAADDDRPFFLYLSPFAPHGPVEPRLDHIGAHHRAGSTPPPNPACNEADVSDKPSWIRDTPDLRTFPDGCATGNEQLDLTLALDEQIGAVVGRLADLDLIESTFVIFASDNGLIHGSHRIGGKSAPYEESVRVPMVVRGPGVAAGAVLPHLVMNIDIAPWLLAIAGAEIGPGSPPVDGESLLDVVTGAVAADDWRDAVLLELLEPVSSPNQPQTVPRYRAVRTPTHVYIEYGTGDVELYDLVADPHQLDNMAERAASDLVAGLRARLDRLATCAGAGCAAASRP